MILLCEGTGGEDGEYFNNARDGCKGTARSCAEGEERSRGVKDAGDSERAVRDEPRDVCASGWDGAPDVAELGGGKQYTKLYFLKLF